VMVAGSLLLAWRVGIGAVRGVGDAV